MRTPTASKPKKLGRLSLIFLKSPSWWRWVQISEVSYKVSTTYYSRFLTSLSAFLLSILTPLLCVCTVLLLYSNEHSLAIILLIITLVGSRYGWWCTGRIARNGRRRDSGWDATPRWSTSDRYAPPSLCGYSLTMALVMVMVMMSILTSTLCFLLFLFIHSSPSMLLSTAPVPRSLVL